MGLPDIQDNTVNKRMWKEGKVSNPPKVHKQEHNMMFWKLKQSPKK